MSEADNFREDLGALLDGELDAPRRTDVEKHLEACESCREELARLKKLSALVGALPRASAPGGLAPSIMSAVTAVTSAEREAAPRPKILHLRRWVGGLTAVAAALLVGIVGVAVLRENGALRRSALAPGASAPAFAARELAMADAACEEAAPEDAPEAPSPDGGWLRKGAGDGAAPDARFEMDTMDTVNAKSEMKSARATGGAAAAVSPAPSASVAVRAPAEPVRADRVARGWGRRPTAPAARPETPVAPPPAREDVALKRKAVAPARQAFDERGARTRDVRRGAGRDVGRVPKPGLELREPEEKLLGERLHFRDGEIGDKEIASRPKAAAADTVAAAPAPAAEDRDALELTRKLRALLAASEADKKGLVSGTRGGVGAEAADDQGGKVPIRIRRRTPYGKSGAEADRIEALARSMGGKAGPHRVTRAEDIEWVSPDGSRGAGKWIREFIVRLPAREVMGFLAAVRSGKALSDATDDRAGPREARPLIGGAEGDAPASPAARRHGMKSSGSERPPAATGGTRAETARAASKDVARIVAIEIVIETEWSPAAAERAKAGAAEATEAELAPTKPVPSGETPPAGR